jgi:hypothetical protein
MSSSYKQINIIRTKLLKMIDSEIQIKNIEELPSLNKEILEYQKNFIIEIKDYSHSLQKIMRGFNTYFKGNKIIQFTKKEKNKINNSSKNINIFLDKDKFPFKFLENYCFIIKKPKKNNRSKTEINTILKINSNEPISKNKEKENKMLVLFL